MNRTIASRLVLALLLVSTLASLSTAKAVKSAPTQGNLSTSEVDIINPEPGQFANYLLQGYGWWNISYNEYVEPHIINSTHVQGSSHLSDNTYWLTVDKRNRLVTDGNYTYWNQTWYFFWIETNVTVGSTIKWSDTNAMIVGSEVVYAAGGYVDCWVANISISWPYYVLSYYDRFSGVMVAYKYFEHHVLIGEVILDATNIPIVWLRVSTKVYFNLSPNPAAVGETLTLEGILLDEFYRSLSVATVRLYARPLAGSWRYVTSLTTDDHGDFTWQATIPSVTGIFIFAVYYPGSDKYESTYSFAVLLIQ